MPKKITAKQRAAANYAVENPSATYEEIAENAGYSDRSNVYKELQRPYVKKYMAQLLDSRPKLGDDKILKNLESQLEAKKTDKADYKTRHNAVITVLELKGHLKNDTPVTNNFFGPQAFEDFCAAYHKSKNR